MSTDDDRIEYLQGRPTASSSGDAELDALRELLASPDTWAEPPSGLEDRVVTAVADAQGADGSATTVASLDAARHRRDRSVRALAAAAALIVVVGIGVFVIGRSDPDDTLSLSVAATELAPDARGVVSASKTTSGWRIDFDVEGLDRLDDGEFYEAWLMNDDGIIVPIGTFNEGTDVVLWAGVPLTEFSTLTVTVEVADGDQSSSGQRVLMATLDEP